MNAAEKILRKLLPRPFLSWAAAQSGWTLARLRGMPYVPPRGAVRFGALRRTTPISRTFGGERGRPVDRFYIDEFLRARSGAIRGDVLEVAEPLYTYRFGGDGVTRSDVLHLTDPTPPVTLVADLTRPENLPNERFDCVICTQVLPFLYDVPAAITGLHRMLRPGGVLLGSVAGIAQISRYDMDRWGHYWGFTSLSLRRLLEAHFDPSDVEIETYGNVLAATALLYGLAAQELTSRELREHDRDYEVIIGFRAVKRV